MGTCTQYDNLMWLSHARGGLDSRVAFEMESHANSCEECRAQLEFSRKIAAVIGLTAAAPPESWTSEAAAQFDLVAPQESEDIFGDLVFDSYLHEKEAVRSKGLGTRQLVFEFPDFEVDLSLEYSGRQLKMLMGHLLTKAADSAAIVQDFSLELRVAARRYFAKPNRLGEFAFTVDAQMTGEPLELKCTFEEGPCVIVLIPS